MFYTYILENAEGRHYIGSCSNIGLRLEQHNKNCVSSTKNKGPFRVIYKEEFNIKSDALKRENEIKSYKGNSKFKKLLVCLDPVV